MFIIGHFIKAIAVVLEMVLNIYMLLIIANAILSWVNPDIYNPVVRFVHNVTDPLLAHIRRTIPVVFSGIDFSPIIVLVGIAFLNNFLVGSLYSLAATFM
ncbi:YggT family protein [Desulfonema magnum]|uniref:YGGT domain-containing protein n=1 Tax=Desulfonema magnum TaxID=45655 RepID=A0A975GT12_9BACT|nr:YggT family protein [Desulfonema magnum]QTA92606.1 YGGT domain-containing protein [Desulfonema magnum]